MFQKVKTCLDDIGRFIRIYITDRNSEENKEFHEKKFWERAAKELERSSNRINELHEKSKSYECTSQNFPRSFRLDTVAPHELLTTYAGESSQIENLEVDLNEVIREDSIYTIVDYYRALWRNVEKTEQSENDRIRYCRARRYIAKAPDEGHYSLLLTKDFSKSLRSISTEYQERVLSAISEISANPFFAHGNAVKPLSHQEGLWRKRVGDYRIVYSPVKKENTVMLLKVAHRSAIYRGY